MLCHIFQLPFYCVSMLIAYFTHSRTSTCCFDCLALFFFCQVDGQECLRTFSSYLCFSHLKLCSCYITKFDQVRFEPLYVRGTRSPRFVIDLKLPKPLCAFRYDRKGWIGQTETHKEVLDVLSL